MVIIRKAGACYSQNNRIKKGIGGYHVGEETRNVGDSESWLSYKRVWDRKLLADSHAEKHFT